MGSDMSNSSNYPYGKNNLWSGHGNNTDCSFASCRFRLNSACALTISFFLAGGFVLAKCGPGPAFVLVPIPPIPQPIPDRYPKVSPLLFLKATSRTLEVLRERQFKEPLGQVARKGIHAKKKAKRETKKEGMCSFSFPFLSLSSCLFVCPFLILKQQFFPAKREN